MKKLFFPAAVIAAITLASCGRQDDGTGTYSPGGSMPVGFRTFVGKPGGANTKAAVVRKDDVETNGFIVHAYNTNQEPWSSYTPTGAPTPNFMANQAVTYDVPQWPNNWGYTPTRYWPVRDGQVSFFAYASNAATNSIPAGLNNVTFPTGTLAAGPAFDFEAHELVPEQSDLLGAIALNKKQSGGTVSMDFYHLLSKIGFTAKTKQDYGSDVEIKVFGLQVKTNADAKIGRKAKFQFGSTFATANWTIASDNYFTLSGFDGEIFLSNPITEALDEADPTLINDPNMFIMLPPNQTIVKEAFTIRLYYSVTTTKDNTTTLYNTTIKVPTEDKGLFLELGKQYTFNFTFSLNAVVFSGINTGGWDDAVPQPDDIGL
jgi:hypothetical protein